MPRLKSTPSFVLLTEAPIFPGLSATLDPKWNPSVRSRPCAPAFEPAPRAGSWRGCGLSDRDGVAFTFEKLVEDLEAFIEALDCSLFRSE